MHIDTGTTPPRTGRRRRHLVTAVALATTIVLLAAAVQAEGTGGSAGTDAAPLIAGSLDELVAEIASMSPDPGVSAAPSDSPSVAPSDSPSVAPSDSPSAAPSDSPAPTPVPTATPVPTPTPSPTPIAPPVRPKTIDAPVPWQVRASLGGVSGDIPLPYHDGCHVSMGGHMPARYCFYGNLRSKTTIALFGDSHALSWFPAVLRLASDRGWRVFSLTMSACVPADIIPWNPATHSVMTACQTWRKAAIARLVRVHPSIILVTGTRGFETINSAGTVLTGKAMTLAWIAGMKRTLSRLVPYAGRVIMVADTPSSRFSYPAGCIAAHPRSELACATPVSFAINYTWLNTEFRVALAKHAGFIDAERWVCPTSPCPLVIGYRVVYRNKGHLTATFTHSMWRKLEQAILADLAKRTAVAGP